MTYNNFSSYLGLGSMRFKKNSDKELKEIIDYAIKNKINYFEVCDFYMGSKCESRITSILNNYPRDSYLLCDKFPPTLLRLSLEEIKQFFYNQLKKCNTNYFDYYLIQSINIRFYKELRPEIIKFFNELREKGIIRNLGFSFHGNADTLNKTLSLNSWDIVQLSLNYYDWYLGDAKQLYNIVKEKDLPIFVMNPTKGGLLINGLSQSAKKNMQHYNINPVNLCFKFLTTLSNVKLILTGVDNLQQLEENISFFDTNDYGITNDEKEIILYNLSEYQKYSIIGCTGCGYCLTKCPQNIPIDKIFQSYNQWIKNNDIEARNYIFDLYEMRQGVLKCKQCKQCETICPQSLPILNILNNTIFYVKR